jgi:tripartite-type tricarboxylate transporter receptor subunit TctC
MRVSEHGMHRLLRPFAMLAGFAGAIVAMAQPYPARSIRIVTAEAGGGNDFAARLIVRGLGDSLGQQAVVDNRGGAGGIIAAEIVARAPPDGYTLLVYASNIWIIPLLRKNVPYDMNRDFAPITWAARAPSTLVVHPSLPAKSVKDLIAIAKAQPGQLNYGSGGSGSTTHLAAELFKSMAKVSILRVSYRGNAPAMNDLIAGHIHLMFATAGTVAPHTGSGRLRALAVTSAQPTALSPGLPTVASAGLPGYESLSIYGVFAPAKTPTAIIQQLNRELVRVLSRGDVKEQFFNAGVETVGSSPEAFAAAIKADVARMSKVISEAGIRDE